MTLLLLAAAALLHLCAAQEKRPVIDWLKNNKDTTTAAALLQQLYPKPISDKARITLLIPTNDVRHQNIPMAIRTRACLPGCMAVTRRPCHPPHCHHHCCCHRRCRVQAIEAFRRDMHLTPAQFKERTGLLDLVVAYHIIPGYTAKELKVQKEPAVAVTGEVAVLHRWWLSLCMCLDPRHLPLLPGDINYVLRFYNTDKGVKVQDVQGNYVNINTKPVVLGNAAIIVIDKVLMSGSYFFEGKAAMNYYPQWSQAKSFAEAVGYPEGTSKEQDMTLLVPGECPGKQCCVVCAS